MPTWKVWKWFHRKPKDKLVPNQKEIKEKEKNEEDTDDLKKEEGPTITESTSYIPIKEVDDDGQITEGKTEVDSSSIHPPPLGKRDKLFRAVNGALITSPGDLYLQKCKVKDDHSIYFKFNNKKKNVRLLRSPHLLTIPIRDFIPSPLVRFIMKLQGVKFIRINTFTMQYDAEVTHDPHIDELDENMKRRFEEALKLHATVTKTDWANSIMSGMKDKKTWWQELGYPLVLLGIVFLFLFAFQIQPNM